MRVNAMLLGRPVRPFGKPGNPRESCRMFVFEFVIALLLVGAVLSLWSARLGVPYPALLALTGAALALMPGVPELTLDPELALALFLAPALPSR
jgi:NhaP-type Na+/H+ or K+/H+ antiporter